jgi:hypothetical protein
MFTEFPIINVKIRVFLPQFLFISIFSFNFSSCGSDNSEIPTIIIDLSKDTQLKLSEFLFEPVILNLPDSTIFGEPEHIEFSDGYYFIHDPNQTKTLTVFDESGNFVSQLTCKGSGPEEIASLDLFAYNPFRKEVVIHERGKGFTIFNFPDFQFKNAIRGFPYLMSLQAIDSNAYAIVEEADEDKNGAVIIIDTNFKQSKQLKLELPIMSAELSYPNTSSKVSSELNYILPNFDNTFYSISSNGFKALWKVNFGNEGVAQNLWNVYNYDNEIEEEITKKNKAAYLHHIAWQNDTLFAWFKYRSLEDIYFAMIHPASQQAKVYSTLQLMRDDIGFPFPVGVKENYFIGIPEDLELLYKNLPDESKKSSVGSKIELAIQQNKTVLLLYALK